MGPDGEDVPGLCGVFDAGGVAQVEVRGAAVGGSHLVGQAVADVADRDDDQPGGGRVGGAVQFDSVVADGDGRAGRERVDGGRPEGRRSVGAVLRADGVLGDGHREHPGTGLLDGSGLSDGYRVGRDLAEGAGSAGGLRRQEHDRFDAVGEAHGIVGRQCGVEVTVERQAGHPGAVPVAVLRAFRGEGALRSPGERVLQQNVFLADSGVQDAHGG